MALARAAWIVPPRSLDEDTAARLRAAQVAVIARYAPVMVFINIFNALVLVAALAFRDRPTLALSWFAVLAAFLTPVAVRLYRRRRKSQPASVGVKAVKRTTINAGVLGAVWGLAPILFFDTLQSDQLVVGCIVVGMICGGSLALATLPAAVLAFTTPLALGSLVGLLRGAHAPIDYFVAPLIFSYCGGITLAALSHGKQFAVRVVAQVRAEARARHDPLTGLPNRTAFEAALEVACARLERYGERFALLYIDLDDFKLVNDRFGHHAGDLLLKQMAGRLSVSLRDNDMLARLGGDEFVMLARGVGDPASAATIADRLGQAFDAAFLLDRESVACGASVGVALAPTDGATPNALLSRADSALYKAKRDRAEASRLYHSGDDQAVRDRRLLSQDLTGALRRGEFFLQFQPIQDLASGRIESSEALARWRHPTRGLVSPGLFIGLAERVGAIHELGEWIMFEACREAARWPKDVGVAVNVSAAQICDHSIVAIVDAALRASGLAPGRLHVEVTESAVLTAAAGAATAIARLHERGVAIVLDDFGTGFSSFDHIRRLPVSGLKIDRSFVASTPDRKSGAIIEAVSHLARSLELDLTAEGIETAAQLAHVQAAGCRLGQGYLFARPMDASDLLPLFVQKRAA